MVASSVARLYKGVGSTWEYTKKWGGIALVKDGAQHHLKLVSLDKESVEWQQELYDGFEYKNPKPFFHVFEGDDAVYGLSFANDGDAGTFYSAVKNKLERGPYFFLRFLEIH